MLCFVREKVTRQWGTRRSVTLAVRLSMVIGE